MDCINKRAIRMASFKGRLAIITISKIKEQFKVRGKKQKLDITHPPGHRYLSEIRYCIIK